MASWSACSVLRGRANRRCCAWSAASRQPTSGMIAIDGEDVTRLPPEQRPTGMVFQSHALWTHMNVFGNLAFGLKLRRLPGRRDPRQGRGRARAGRPHRLRPPHDQPALGRPAAARRAGPLAGPRAEDPAPRRTLRQPRPASARAAARGGARHPAAPEDHHALRHPRAGRGAVAWPTGSSSCATAGPNRPTARTSIYRDAADALRRRLHRHDEPDRRHGRARAVPPAGLAVAAARPRRPGTLAVRPEALALLAAPIRARRACIVSPTSAPMGSSMWTCPTAAAQGNGSHARPVPAPARPSTSALCRRRLPRQRANLPDRTDARSALSSNATATAPGSSGTAPGGGRDPVFTRARILEGMRLGASVEVDLVVHGDGGMAILHNLSLEARRPAPAPSAPPTPATLRALHLRATTGARCPTGSCCSKTSAPNWPQPAAPRRAPPARLQGGHGRARRRARRRLRRGHRRPGPHMILSGGDLAAVTALVRAAPGLRMGYDPCHGGSLEALRATRRFRRLRSPRRSPPRRGPN